MKSFSEQMRGAIRAGVSPANAMRETWALVKRGSVAPPPRRARGGGRGARRNAYPSAYAIPNRRRSNPPYEHIGGLPIYRPTDADLPRHVRTAAKRARSHAVAKVAGGYQLVKSEAQLREMRNLRHWYEGGSGPAPNPRPTLARVGQLVAAIVQQSGAPLDAVADAHARVYGYARGDVYEHAARLLARRNPRGRYVCPSCTRGSHGLCIAGSGCQCPAPRHEALRREAATIAAREAREYAEHLRGLGRRSRRNPYYAELEAASGMLLGGVTKHTSWPFQRRQDAERLLVTLGRANLDAGRKLGRTRVLYRRRDPLRRKAITAAELGNPPAVLIYDKVLKIFARKGRGPHKGQPFVHRFSSSPRMLGLPNGDLLITGR